MHVTEMTGAVTGAELPGRAPVFLATKIFPPRLPAGLIDRPRLICLAGEAENKRLTVIKAPAGFGKTSLALTWLARLRTQGVLAAWLALDSEDDEPARFLYHLAQALQHACGNVGASAIGLTTAASLVPAHAIVSTLINDLVEVDDEVCIFLDDYHLISLQAVHDAVSFFVENAPSHVHVVICTRTDPPLPLARLRAGNGLLELDGSSLRFDFDETRSFVEHECPGKLQASGVKSLFASTEGWAAALRISASVLARASRKQDTALTPASGVSRPFAAYLEDMVKRLPSGMVEFMLRTSILERLTAPLCEALTDVKTSQAMLESIVARQLLLEPMDMDGSWFRFHHLMGEYLHRRLQMQYPDQVADLHRRACKWYASESQWTDAVRHAIAAGDTEEAVTLIGNCAMSLVTKGDLLTLLGWQRQFPARLMRSQVKVTLAIAWGMALAMRFDEARAMLDAIEQDAANSGPDPESIHWECQAIRSVVAALGDDAHTALPLAEACLQRPSTDIWSTNVASNVARFVHWKAGNLEALYAVPWIPYSIEEDRRNVFASVYRLCLLGHVEMQQLHFPLAERYFQESLRLAEQHAGPKSIAVALVAPMIGQLRYEEGRLDEAEAMVADLLPVIDAAVLLDSALMAYRLLVRIAVARSDTVQAYALIERAQALAYTRKWDRLSAAALVERTRLNLTEGRTVEAAASAAQLDQLTAAAAGTSAAPEIATYRGLASAYVAMARGRTQDAADALNAALGTIEGKHGYYLGLRLRTVLALVWMEAGERARAVEILVEVLRAGAPAGLYQSVVDQGPRIVALLQAVREELRGAAVGAAAAQGKELAVYVDRLLEATRAMYQPGETRARSAEREPLSARERDIIGLIAQGQSNKEIARTLGIAPETVKSHVKSIFVKLSVDKRAQAVARAQSLGLVGTV
jgi:LuxR family transcriptional regulator, maltose regulon positive regulatory protein